ncbi:hypothetical protein Thimo_3470 [Thioflavicoccus mobilis 8321]|uniref:Uncharacterized protein n=1 Tax=Thioflavicoccus mobilis 8321 TaxID=765912 RepID=L0GZE7_9GAMM|nr:hypothetical protein Thimo_3470 [Thioflavicoccus mobilis 8321]
MRKRCTARINDNGPNPRPRTAPTVPTGRLSSFHHTSKISRQVLRFFKHSFLKPASPALYERQLRPMLLGYLCL